MFFFPMAHSEDGERAERLTNTLFGAKDRGRHRQERAVALTSLRRTETTLRLSYGFGGELTVY